MVNRLPLRVLVSAVARLEEPTGATAKQIHKYLKSNYAVVSNKTLSVALRKAVREGFLGRNRSKYLPTWCKCRPTSRRRREDYQTEDAGGEYCKRRRKAGTATSLLALSSLVPSFISKIFQ